ncbi:MAG: flavin reductase family protein [Eggerthellaceae bacterium]|nr:flavin reductase family protein [Eggerthellaceae bacterium]
MKEKINVLDYASEILKALQKGVLITTQSYNKTNTMALGWGALAIEWQRPIFIAFVRKNRYTHELLEENPEFTINVPLENSDLKSMALAGSRTGRGSDKIKTLGLTTEHPETISVPGIKEFPLTLECKVIYKQEQDLSALPPEDVDKFYPKDVDSNHHGVNKDPHTAYYGEIVNAYIIKSRDDD